MVITPDTEVRLINLPLNINSKHQLKFSSKIAQENYFLTLDYYSLSEYGEDNFTYQRKDDTMYYPRCVDQIDQYNYCMYKNANHENLYYKNKWIYAYIVNMTYENDNCTRMQLKTDVYQTWQFDIEYLPCFIEREHLSSAEDVPGANLLPEGLETGEYKVNASSGINGLKPICILGYGRNPVDDGLTSGNRNIPSYNGIPARYVVLRWHSRYDKWSYRNYYK